MPCTVTSGSGSPGSGSSSNTATQMTTMDEAEEAVVQLMATAAHQAVSPLLGRPLPIRKRQRKPCRKSKPVETEADSPSTSTPKKRGRKPKAIGRAAVPHLPLFITLLPLLLLRRAYCCAPLPLWIRASVCLYTQLLSYPALQAPHAWHATAVAQ